MFPELNIGLVAGQKLRLDTYSVAGDLRFFPRILIGIYAATPARAILAGLIAETQGDRRVAKALIAHLVRGRRHMIRDILVRGRDAARSARGPTSISRSTRSRGRSGSGSFWATRRWTTGSPTSWSPRSGEGSPRGERGTDDRRGRIRRLFPRSAGPARGAPCRALLCKPRPWPVFRGPDRPRHGRPAAALRSGA